MMIRLISKYQKLSDKFIREFKDKISFDSIQYSRNILDVLLDDNVLNVIKNSKKNILFDKKLLEDIFEK